MVVGIIFVACPLNKVTVGRVFILNFVITKVWQIFGILWHSPSGNHSQNNSAQIWLHTRYECRKKRKKIPSIFLATYHKNLMIWKKKSSKCGEFGFFFSLKIFCICQNDIFQVKYSKNLPVKETLGWRGEGFTFPTSISYYLKHMLVTWGNPKGLVEIKKCYYVPRHVLCPILSETTVFLWKKFAKCLHYFIWFCTIC